MINDLIEKLLQVEGGYVNDPKDSGGVTNYGITEHLARASGYTGSMADLPRNTAKMIYREEFAEQMRLEQLCDKWPDLAYELLEMSVHLGVGTTTVMLQRCLNVLNRYGTLWPDLKTDGIYGDKTHVALLKALAGKENEDLLCRMLNSMQGTYYIELCEARHKDEKFIRGWFKRVKV